MLELDIILLCIALAMTIYTRRKETWLLLIMFFGSSSAAYIGIQAQLGALWYPVLAVYLMIFCTLSKSIGITIVYFCMQMLCLLSLQEFQTERVLIYNSFAPIIMLLYLAQLGISAYGYYDDIKYRNDDIKFNRFSIGYTKVNT